MNFQFKPKFLKINSLKIADLLQKNNKADFLGKYFFSLNLERNYDDVILASISSKDNKTKFIGMIDKLSYERKYYGFQLYENNDIYFGNFETNLKNNFGCYLFSPENKENSLLSEFYLGNFKNDQMQTKGMYLWMEELNQKVDASLNGKEFLNNLLENKEKYLNEKDEKLKNENFENCNFSGFVGDIKNNEFGKGIYFQKQENNYKIFYGNMNTNDIRNYDENGLLLISNNKENKDQIVYGKVNNGKFIEGKLFITKEDENKNISILKIIDFKENVQINEKTNDINQNDYENIKIFGQLCFEEDWFGKIFDVYKNFYEFLNNINNDEINFYNETNIDKIYIYLKSFNIELLKKLIELKL